MPLMKKNVDNKIINIWRDNLEQEMARLRSLIKTYNFIAMDTEFPGVVAKPIGTFTTQSAFTYQQMRCNIDLLKIIQLGITLSDYEGNMFPVTFQFNFNFDIDADMYSQESIELLVKADIDFERHKERGIERDIFGELLITSGLVMNPDVVYLTFHSSYDFGYLTKLMLGNPLSDNENDFFKYLNALFPNFYDIKYMMKGSKYIKRGLQEIADDMGVERIGVQHQAGSDSYITCMTFWKVKEILFENDIDDEKWLNRLYGIEKKAV